MPNLHEIAVSLTAKSAGFDQGINQALASTKRLEDAMKRLQSTMRLTVPAVTPGTTAIRTTTTASNSLLSTLTGLAAGYFTLNTAIKGVSAAFSASASVERQERAWRGIAESVAGGRQEIEFVRTSADKLGVSFGSLEEGYRKIAASAKGSTLEGAAARQIFLDISQALQTLGAPSDAIANSMRTLGQMISTGVVQADELRNELGNHLPGVMNIAAKSMNMTTLEFRKLQETGGILTNEFLPNFARMVRQTYVPATEAGTAATLSLEQQIARAGNILTEFAAKSFKDSGVESFANFLIKKFNDVGREILEAGRRLDELAKRNTDKAITAETKGTPLTMSKESIAAQATLQSLERRIVEAEAVQRMFDDPNTGPLAQLWARTNILPQVQMDVAFLDGVKRERDMLLKTMEKFREGPGLGAEDLGAPDQVSALTQKGMDQAAKIKAAREEATALTKAVDELGVALALEGKTRWEIETEQLKELNKLAEKYNLTYKAVLPLPGTGTPTPGSVAPLSTLTRPSAETLALIQEKATKYKLDAALFESLIFSESQFNPKATSPKGAMGYGQLMPRTAESLGVTNPYDPAQNLEGSAKYLAQLIAKFPDDIRLALAAYNAGPGRAQEALASFPKTQKYVKNTLARTATLGGAVPGAGMASPLDPILAKRKQLQESIGWSQTDEAMTKALAEANADVAETMDTLLDKLQTGTDAWDAEARSIYERDAALAATAGNTVELGRNLDALDAVLDKSTVSTTAHGRALILERMNSVEGYEATKLLAQARVEEADKIEKAEKAHKELTVTKKALQEVDETLLRLSENNSRAIEDIIAQLKAGVSPIRDMVTGMTEFEELFKRLQELGAQPATLQVAEGLRQQSSAEFQAIQDGAANMASEIQSRTIASLTGSKDAWKDFGNFAVQEMARIVFKAMNFEQNMTALLTKAGSALLKMFGGMAGGSSGDIDFNAGGGGSTLGGSSGDIDFALGGPVGAGQVARVGEAGRELMLSGGRIRLVGLHGPEVVRSRESAFVIPHQQTMTLLRGQRQLDNVVHTMARRAMGGSVNAGQAFLAGEAGIEGVVSRGGRRNQGGVNITVNVQGVKDMQSFVQPRSQAELQRAMAAALRAAQGST